MTVVAMGVAFVFAVCLAAASSVRSDAVPVLMWGSDVGDSPFSALRIASKDELSEFVRGELRSHKFVVVFVEPTLSVEDFSLTGKRGESPFASLRTLMRGERSAFVRAADEPSAVLDEIVGRKGVHRVRITDADEPETTSPSKARFLVVSLQDARDDETRCHMLARHDRIVADTYEGLKRKHRDVVAVYTGERASWITPERRSARVSRHLLAAEPDAPSGFYNGSNLVFVYMRNIVLRTNDETKNLTNGEIVAQYTTDGELTAELDFSDVKLQLVYSKLAGYWKLDYVKVQDTNLTAKEEIGAPMGFSYHCGQNTVFTNRNSTDTSLIVDGFQTQPFFNESTYDRFASAYDCVGVMTVAIWSGLLLVALLLFILSCGIMMIMDIRTMDRFDDPKGKTITINAAE